MLRGCRHPGRLGIGLLVVSGCVRFNPVYEETRSGTAGQSGTSGAGSSGLATSSSSTLGSATAGSGTTGEAKPETTDQGTTRGSSGSFTSSGGSDTSSSDDGSDTSVKFDLGDPKSLVIVLYPTGPVRGDFASLAGDVEAVGAEECVSSAQEAGLRLDCEDVFPILGWPARPLGDLDESYPALVLGPLLNAEGLEVAEGFDTLLAGEVEAEFAELVLDPVGGEGDGQFWWGYGEPEHSHCGSWGSFDLEGRTRVFGDMGVDDVVQSCEDEFPLLCACIAMPS